MGSPTLTDVQGAFKVLGKLIYASQHAPTWANTMKEFVSETHDQCANGSSNDFGSINYAAIPLTTSIKSITDLLDKMPASVKIVVNGYLQNVVAPMLELPVTAQPTSVVTTLAATMQTLNATVAPSGLNNSNPSGFCVYVKNNYGVVLPQSATPNIDDAWISGIVIP